MPIPSESLWPRKWATLFGPSWVICPTGIGFDPSRTTWLEVGKDWFLEGQSTTATKRRKEGMQGRQRGGGMNIYNAYLYMCYVI